jgi:hypothetical protein
MVVPDLFICSEFKCFLLETIGVVPSNVTPVCGIFGGNEVEADMMRERWLFVTSLERACHKGRFQSWLGYTKNKKIKG